MISTVNANIMGRQPDSLQNKQGAWDCWTSPRGPGSGRRRGWARVWPRGSCGTAGGCCSDIRQSEKPGSVVTAELTQSLEENVSVLLLWLLLEKKLNRSRRWLCRHNPHRKNDGLWMFCWVEQKKKRDIRSQWCNFQNNYHKKKPRMVCLFSIAFSIHIYMYFSLIKA